MGFPLLEGIYPFAGGGRKTFAQVLGNGGLILGVAQKPLYVWRIQPVCFAYVICTYTATLGALLTGLGRIMREGVAPAPRWLR
jgi:hypothetical protein